MLFSKDNVEEKLLCFSIALCCHIMLRDAQRGNCFSRKDFLSVFDVFESLVLFVRIFDFYIQIMLGFASAMLFDSASGGRLDTAF